MRKARLKRRAAQFACADEVDGSVSAAALRGSLTVGLPAARNDKTTQKTSRLTRWHGRLENGGGERSSRETRHLARLHPNPNN